MTDLSVHSPSGAPDQFTREEIRDGDLSLLSLRIGDPDVPLDTRDASYVIEYTLEGALRTFSGVPELFIDVTSGDYPHVESFSALVTAPEGVDRVRCLVGPDECSAEVVAGEGTFTASGADDTISIVAALPAGSVAHAELILVTAERDAGSGAGVLTGIGTALVAAGAMFGISRIGRQRDERYTRVAPGLTDPGGPTATTKRFPVPVQFAPPPISVAEAGVLLKRRYHPTQLAASLISLAVRGAVVVGSKPLLVRRADPTVELSQTEARLVGLAPEDGVLATPVAHRMGTEMASAAKRTLESSGWFKRNRGSSLAALAPVFGWVVWVGVLLAWALFGNFLGGFTLPVVIGLAVGLGTGPLTMLSAPGGPSLTAEGTARLDEVEGFRLYIATAEADQLNFEAEHDIFRRYLPWAVLFELTERWTRICRQLAEAGHIAPLDTSFWQGGTSFDDGFATFDREVRARSGSSTSSRRSGSRSGFSRGSRGGSGGGSRARSW